MHQTLFVFDIETIPDTDAAPSLTGEQGDIDTRRKALSDYHLEITGGKNDFLRQPFHKVVAISFLEAEIHQQSDGEYYTLKDLRSGGRVEASEKELLQGFFHYVGGLNARLVSFNGRTFDLPVLRYRAMKHNIAAPWLYKSGDKWNSYTQRYSLDWHCDLLEALSDFGAAARIRLNEVCSILGFPGKMDVSGGDVTALYDANQLEAIRNYCECDVLSTYLLYLRYQFHRGMIAAEHHRDAVEDAVSFLEEQGQTRPHLNDFLTHWRAL